MRVSKSRAFPLFVAAFMAHGAFACGGSDGSEVGVKGSGPNGSGAGGPNLGNVGSGSGVNGTLTGMHDGGTVPLTPEQVADIEDAACTGWAAEGENLPAVLQLVVDVSRSMEDDAPGAGRGQSKWDVTREALRDALVALPASASAGVLYYPNQAVELADQARDVDACVNVDAIIPIAPLGAQGSNQRDTLDQSLDDAETNGYTPTHDAYKYALESSLQTYQTQANRFMLLITDGAPTMALGCIGEMGGGGGGGMVVDQPTQPIIDEVAKASAAGIKTFIIGSPGSEESSSGDDKRPWLSEAAQVGGTAPAGCSNDGPNYCHMDMTQAEDFSQALVDGLAIVVGQVIDSCTFTIPEPPQGQSIDLNLTTLVVQTSSGSKVVLPDNTGACTEGWQTNAAGQIVLCSASCAEIKGDASARVRLMFGCSTDQVVPVQ